MRTACNGQSTHLDDLLLHVDGVCDGGAVWLHLGVLPGLTTSSQGKNFLSQIGFQIVTDVLPFVSRSSNRFA